MRPFPHGNRRICSRIDRGSGGRLVNAKHETLVKLVDPTSAAAWSDLLARNRSTVFHSPDWLGVVADTYGFTPRAAIAVTDGAVTAGVPYVEIDDMLGPRVVTLPFSDFTDPIISSPLEWETLSLAISGQARPWTLRCLWSREVLDDPNFEVIGRAAWHRIDVTRSSDEVWESLDAGARRAIRKARSSGLEVGPATTREEVHEFFELHRGIRRHKYGLLAQPRAFFDAIWERFLEPGRGALLLARSDGTVAGGVLFLEWADTLYYKFNASHPDFLGSRPNDLVLWTGLELARESGLGWVDLGVSDLDQPGLIAYKRKYATDESEVTTVRNPVGWEPDSRTGETRNLLNDLTDLLVGPGVDDAVAEQAGNALYRYFT